MRGVPGLYAELFGYGEEVRRRLVDLSVSFSLRYYLNKVWPVGVHMVHESKYNMIYSDTYNSYIMHSLRNHGRGLKK